MVAQQVGITQQLLQVLTYLLNAFGAWFTFKAAAGVSNEILQAIGFFQSLGLHTHECPPPSTTSVFHHSLLFRPQENEVKGLRLRCAIAQPSRDLPGDLDDLSSQLLQHLCSQPMRWPQHTHSHEGLATAIADWGRYGRRPW